jgi:hypothetical protein
MLLPVSVSDLAMKQRYGIGFEIASRNVHNAHHSRNPLGFTIADRLTQPHLNLAPLQPLHVTGRPVNTDYDSHKFAKKLNFSVVSPEHSIQTFTGDAGTSISLATPVDEWTEEEEDLKCSLQSQTSHDAHCMATLFASSQTSPQDYQGIARKQSGGFPLSEVLQKAHDDTHPGFLCTWRRVIKAIGPRAGRTQASIKEEVKRYCDACLVCQKIKPVREKLLLRAGTICSRPFSSYAFDIVTLSEPDADGNHYILVCVDSFSRAVELFTLKHANASEVFQALNDVLCR